MQYEGRTKRKLSCKCSTDPCRDFLIFLFLLASTALAFSPSFACGVKERRVSTGFRSCEGMQEKARYTSVQNLWTLVQDCVFLSWKRQEVLAWNDSLAHFWAWRVSSSVSKMLHVIHKTKCFVCIHNAASFLNIQDQYMLKWSRICFCLFFKTLNAIWFATMSLMRYRTQPILLLEELHILLFWIRKYF